MDVREEGGGGGGCREGDWGRRDWTEKEKGKEREGEVGIFFYYMWAPHKHMATGGKKFNRVAAT